MAVTGFSSPRSDAFPAGLRVLVVDDDPTWLKILEKMLKKCSYEVTTCGLAREALDLLRERKDGFDIVISDVNMPDMDGFKLLELVGLEMDLPVIMMSVDGETSRVMKGVQHGACDYLLKPIRMKELRNIWQHVFRKRIHEVRDIESHECFEELQMMRNGSEYSDDGFLFGGNDPILGKKRKELEKKHDENDVSDSASVKKARVVWTVDLHQKFVKAVNQIGFDKVGPKKILDLMNVPWLTRENVASHLQKYRLYLSRLQKENGLRVSFNGVKQSDPSPKDLPSNLCLHNSINIHQKDDSNAIFRAKIHEHDFNKSMAANLSDPQKASCSKTGQNLSFQPFDSIDPLPFSWNEQIVDIHHYKKEDEKQEQEEEEKPHFPLERDKKPEQLASMDSPFRLFGVQSYSQTGNSFSSSTEPNKPSTWKNKNPEFLLENPILDLEACLAQAQGNAEVIAEFSPYLFDALRFDYEYPYDPVEYPVIIDQGLFA